LFDYITEAIMSRTNKQASLESLDRETVEVPGSRRPNTARSVDLAGRKIAGYRLLRLLGRGGMGEVYLGEHRRSGRRCAIKLIRTERAADKQSVARFKREVRAAAKFAHPNIVRILEDGRTENGTTYYVMEYLPGISLEELIATEGPQSAARVIHFLRQACRALGEVHARGLIHRDVKPANLFVTRRCNAHDVLKVLDFGLVKQLVEVGSARLTHDGAVSGTPHFMSPEQARGSEAVDARSDIYSLGAVAYALLTGRPPFEGHSALEVLIAHARDAVTPPSQCVAEVPADLEKIVLRCLTKKPEQRYQSMAELEQALRKCAAAQWWTDWFETRCCVYAAHDAA
jgi:serine/threonine-protein kinase